MNIRDFSNSFMNYPPLCFDNAIVGDLFCQYNLDNRCNISGVLLDATNLAFASRGDNYLLIHKRLYTIRDYDFYPAFGESHNSALDSHLPPNVGHDNIRDIITREIATELYDKFKYWPFNCIVRNLSRYGLADKFNTINVDLFSIFVGAPRISIMIASNVEISESAIGYKKIFDIYHDFSVNDIIEEVRSIFIGFIHRHWL